MNIINSFQYLMILITVPYNSKNSRTLQWVSTYLFRSRFYTIYSSKKSFLAPTKKFPNWIVQLNSLNLNCDYNKLFSIFNYNNISYNTVIIKYFRNSIILIIYCNFIILFHKNFWVILQLSLYFSSLQYIPQRNLS